MNKEYFDCTRCLKRLPLDALSDADDLCQDCYNYEEENLYICGDCGLTCDKVDRLKYCDPDCAACKYEINMLKEIEQ